MEPIICLVGPTASGKTRLAVELAKALDGEVVSCDSMQLYRHMDVGTAKPTREEMQGVRHHMLDVCEPWEDFSVGRYVPMAEACVQEILSRGKTVIVAGGTGLYADSLILGRTFAPVPSTGKRAQLEALAAAEGGEGLLLRLQKVDPARAERLHPSDVRRIVRALEVYEETGKTITQHDLETRAQPPRHEALWLGLDFPERSRLYARIDRRVEQMLQSGLLDEIRGLLSLGVRADMTAMQAIGYKEYFAALEGRCSLDEATALVQQRSRNYAKRQLTWFRRNERLRWLRWTEDENFSAIFEQALREIRFFAG